MATDQNTVPARSTHPIPLVFGAGAAIGVLGGTEFRLPLLIGMFGFAALSAVILNKAMSLAMVLVALPARLAAGPASALGPHWTIAVKQLAGSLIVSSGKLARHD